MIDPKEEVRKITSFIRETLSKQKKDKVVIGVSGGVDSATVLYLLKNAIPLEHIQVVTLPYFNHQLEDINEMTASIYLPKENLKVIPIKPMVDSVTEALKIAELDVVRKGNVQARKIDGLVCGTENRSESLLGYFTRFGDEASDIEPIRHLYKTQVYELARYLEIPQRIIDKKPSANLWNSQTDEEEFGFSYEEADQVLYLYFDKQVSVEEIEKQGFKSTKQIIDFANKNFYKHNVPYVI